MNADKLAATLRQHGQCCIGDLFTDERGVEFLTNAKPRTLRAWRASKRGPPCIWINRWLFDLDALAAWMAAQTHRHPVAGNGSERHGAASSDIDTGAPMQSNNRAQR